MLSLNYIRMEKREYWLFLYYILVEDIITNNKNMLRELKLTKLKGESKIYLNLKYFIVSSLPSSSKF